MLHKQLTGMGAPVDDHDFTAMILSSIPDSYCPIIQATTAALHATKTTLLPETLIHIVTKGSDHCHIDKGTMAGDSALTLAHPKRDANRPTS